MTLLVLHAGTTLMMVGLIWFVQVVHYPLFALVSDARSSRFAHEHQRRTSLVVVPLMLTEAGTAVALLMSPPSSLAHEWLWVGVLLLAVVWLSTALLQLPLHRRLSRGHEAAIVRRLVATNWLRTVAWSARGCLVLALLADVSRDG